MTRAARRRAQQQMPQSAHGMPRAERRPLVDQANAFARNARALGFMCIVDLGEKRNPYKPEITIEIWTRQEGDAK